MSESSGTHESQSQLYDDPSGLGVSPPGTHDDIIFDRNEGSSQANSEGPSQANPEGSIYIQQLKNIIDKLPLYLPEKITSATQRVLTRCINSVSVHADISALKSISNGNNLEFIDEDIFIAGSIKGNVLIINAGPIHLTINLTELVCNAMLYKRADIIRLIMKYHANIFELEPNVMIMCAESHQFQLMSEMIDEQIPIHIQEYRCVYYLAKIGQLDLLEKIMTTYQFPNITTIIGKICVIAIMNGCINILAYFCPREVFHGAYDIFFTYFINGIIYG